MYHTFQNTVVIYLNFACSAMQRVSFVHVYICKEPAVMCMSDQGLTYLYESVFSYSTLISVAFGPLKSTSG